jgi:hypothetical protein
MENHLGLICILKLAISFAVTIYQLILNDRYWLPIQPIDATHALKRSAGVSNSNVSLGRSLSRHATAFSFVCECTDKSVCLAN